ncbi:hypothetical protein NM688_g9046 [Phlebia brevispora]|uniref:Uncharacterized protein n=1 Tax=Phlebia brevispora TaxID=194682 RepID=A0ACC1RJX9_9APHY|nr:hypothetical protein NM688_g9046 [Phlebia brevispora]
MSDSFADLWNSTAPIKPAEPPRTLGAITPALAGQSKPQNDVFSLLAASSTPSSTRSSTPSYVTSQQAQKPQPSKSVTQLIKKAPRTDDYGGEGGDGGEAAVRATSGTEAAGEGSRSFIARMGGTRCLSAACNSHTARRG